jgi:hypothetical protein
LTPTSIIADEDVKLAIQSEGDDTAIVIAARRLGFITLSGGHRSTVILKGTQFNQIIYKREVCSIPDEFVHAIAEQRYFQSLI